MGGKNKPQFEWKKKITAFFISQGITLFGSSLVQFAIIWYIAKTTSSGVMVTLSTFCSFLPQVCISLFAGVWVDRYDRKKLIIFADAFIAISTLILALFMMNGIESLWPILVVSVIRSFGAGIQTPAVNSLIPQIVPNDKLMKVNGINGSIQSVINLVTPAVSGAVLSYGPIYNIMMIDVVTAAIGISVLLLITIKHHQETAATEQSSYFQELEQGLQYSFHNKFVKQIMLVYMCYTVLIVPAGFLNVLMVTRVFGDSYWYLTLNEMTFFIGATVGGLLLGIWGGFKNRLATLSLGLASFGVFTLIMGFINTFWIYLELMLLTGISMPLGSSPVMVLLQEKVPANMQGRVFSLVQIVFSAFMPIGMVIFGPMADVMPIQWLMIAGGVALCVLALTIRFSKNFFKQGISESTPDVQ